MIGGRTVRGVLVASAAVVLLVASWSGASAAAQPVDPSGTADPAATVAIGVEAVSPWVAPDADWTAELRLTGVPSDASISYSIRQPATGGEAKVRDALIAGRNGTDESKVMRSSVTDSIADLTDPSGRVRLVIPVRGSTSGDRTRTFIPNPGVYPVVVTVTSAGGDRLATTTLSLNRLPEAKAGRTPFRLGLLVTTEPRGGFDDDGAVDVSPALRAAVTRVADIADDAGDLPVHVDISPESIVAMTQSTTPGDLELVDRLRSSLAHATLVRTPWANLHLEAWATTGAADDVRTSMLDGQQAVFGRFDRPVDPRVWVADDATGPAGLALLGDVGVASTVVETGRLTDARPPSGESGFTRPVTLRGAAGTTLPAMVLDPELQRLLDTPADDPALSAHRIITQLVGAWLADDRERGTVLRLDDAADLGVIAALCDLLRTVPSEASVPISVVAPAEVGGLPPITTRQAGRDVRWERDVVTPDDVPDVRPVADRLGSARRLVDDYAAIVPASDPAASTDAILIQRSLDRRVPVATQERLLVSTVGAMRADLRRLTASKPRSLTVISRDTTVPLRLTNGMGRPVRVRLRLKSPRLVFKDGAEQTLTLEPGLNRFDVRVDVRASGQFVMQAEVVAPASERVLASTRQTIRSRTFSGVGLMLSGGALLFLVIWWSRTLRRRERPGTDEPPDPADRSASDDALDAPGVQPSPS